MPRSEGVRRSPWFEHKEDLHIPKASPEGLAKAIMQSGAKPRPETKRNEKQL